MKIGPQVLARSTTDLVSLAADKGFDSKAFRQQLRDAGVSPLIKHRIYMLINHAHNARLDTDLCNQRALYETGNSSVKRSLCETV